jgi:hypothetical protein
MVDQLRQQQTLYLRAVRRYVSDAIAARVVRSSSEFTSEVLRSYPNCTLSQPEIERAVVDAAAAAGVSLPATRYAGRKARPVLQKSA